MRNLARLTYAAIRAENGPAPAKVKAPHCTECRRACQQLPNGTYQAHCWKHNTPQEWQEYKAAWKPIWDAESQPPE